MKMRSVLMLSALLAVIGQLPPAALASTDSDSAAGSTQGDNGTVRFVSGGVGASSMQAIAADEHAYNLKLLFVSKGEYLADIHVGIRDSKGKSVLQTMSAGPVLLVKMPAGHYVVSMQADAGSELTQAVDVSDDRLSSYELRFPAKEQ